MRRPAPLDAAYGSAHILPMKQILLIVVMAGFVIAVFANVFTGFDASSMSLHGWIALALGSVLSLALGIGLMALVFYSARRGYDDRIEQDVPEQDKTAGEN